MCSNPLNSKGIPAVPLMSGSPTFDIDQKEKQKQGKLKTLPRPTVGEVFSKTI